MILYPTETVYGLGINAFDFSELEKLYQLKGRETGKPVSVLVRDLADIKRWAECGSRASKIAATFLPGPLSLVLRAKDNVPKFLQSKDGTLSFRISSDPTAQKLIAEFIEEYDAPLTCTSANLSGLPTMPTPEAIMLQFGEQSRLITRVIDGGERVGYPSTIISILDDQVVLLREGMISLEEIMML